jgi:hypothetical protein
LKTEQGLASAFFVRTGQQRALNGPSVYAWLKIPSTIRVRCVIRDSASQTEFSILPGAMFVFSGPCVSHRSLAHPDN